MRFVGFVSSRLVCVLFPIVFFHVEFIEMIYHFPDSVIRMTLLKEQGLQVKNNFQQLNGTHFATLCMTKENDERGGGICTILLTLTFGPNFFNKMPNSTTSCS